MTKKKRRPTTAPRERRIRIRGVRRDDTDIRKLADALIQLAAAQSEADAQAEHEQIEKRKSA